MKTPNLNQVHFRDSLELLRAGNDIKANCGVIVPKAEFPYYQDTKEFPLQELSGINLCLKCLSIGEQIEEKHYRYGLLSQKRKGA